MTDVLLRNVPEEVLEALDAQAAHLGISRTEYLRRRLAEVAATSTGTLTVEDLARSAHAFGDLADPEVMSDAWR